MPGRLNSACAVAYRAAVRAALDGCLDDGLEEVVVRHGGVGDALIVAAVVAAAALTAGRGAA